MEVKIEDLVFLSDVGHSPPIGWEPVSGKRKAAGYGALLSVFYEARSNDNDH